MTGQRILIAGIGNVFRGDDGFGVAVIEKLKDSQWSDSVQLADFGIRAYDFAWALLDGGYEAVLIVDLLSRGQKPGTISVIEPVMSKTAVTNEGFDIHSTDPVRILQWVRQMGGELKNIYLVGCEPEVIGSEDDILVGLSPAVEKSVSAALILIESMIRDLVSGKGIHEAEAVHA